ncbi:MAG TPA: TIGR04552 family protein [Polyangiaceae bacterium]|nr:TIGR04552 family protein [Polyangiaceae bacterium]
MASPDERLKRLDELTLGDLEALRLALRGESVIDWHRLHFHDLDGAREFLRSQEFDPDDAGDRERMESIKAEAVAYLRRHFDFAIPKPIEHASTEELLMLASGKGHRQVCACTVLKAMHIIHHVDGRELLFMLPASTHEVFHLVEEKVYSVIGGMLAAGLPVAELIGGRKNKDSLYTKLLSKQETVAAAIYDKLRFRIVTNDASELLPVLQYLTHRLFPFNYVLPGQSINTLVPFRTFCEAHPHLKGLLPELQGPPFTDLTPTDNGFSASSFRIMHFVVDMPVRVPPALLERCPPGALSLGPVIFMLCEFQLLDRATESANEQGDASHARYKQRQREAVARRLKLGTREPRLPPNAARKAPTEG